jgi:hypothetical protein
VGTINKLLERHLFLLFLDSLAVVLCFFTLQDKHNIHTFSANYSRKARQRLDFLPVSKDRTDKFDIFRQLT